MDEYLSELFQFCEKILLTLSCLKDSMVHHLRTGYTGEARIYLSDIRRKFADGQYRNPETLLNQLDELFRKRVVKKSARQKVSAYYEHLLVSTSFTQNRLTAHQFISKGNSSLFRP